jgi:hypothetical protein
VEELDDVVGNLARGGELVGEVVELGCGGKSAIPEEEGDLFEGGFLGELVDVDSAIGEDAFAAIDETDGGFVGYDILKTFGSSGGHIHLSGEIKMK